MNVIPTENNMAFIVITYFEFSKVWVFCNFSPNTTQNFSINCGLPNLSCLTVWLLHSWESYTVWLLHSVTGTQLPIIQFVDGAINLLAETKVTEIQNCLGIPNFLGRVTYIKVRWVIDHFNLSSKFSFTSQDTENYTFTIFSPVLVAIAFCYPELTCIFYLVFISQLVVKCLFVEMRLRGWIISLLSVILSLRSQSKLF